MSFGIGLGAFMQGMGQGMAMGRTINDVRERAATREAAQGAYRQSSKEREVAISDAMAGGAAAPAEGSTPAPAAPPAAQPPEAQGITPVVPAAAVTPPAAPPGRRGDAPQAVISGIAARAALDPASPTYAQDIARTNDGVVAQTMGGARTPRPAEGITLPAAAPAAPAAPAGLPAVPAAPRGPVSREQAEREVGSVFDFYMQRGAPRVVEQMLASGNVEQAQQFQTWIRGEGVQRGMRSWAGAIRAAQTGDADGFLRHARSAYNNGEYSPDGQSLTASRVLRDSQGGVTGMELTVRGRDGTESVQRFNGSADLYRQAIGFLAPEQQFQHYTQELTAARTAQTRLAMEDRTERRLEVREGRAENRAIRGENRGEARTVRTEGRGATESDRRSQREFQEALERDTNASLLRQAEAAARARGDRPEDVRRNLETIRNNRAATDMAFSRLPVDQQVAEAARVYREQRGAADAIGQPARPGAAAGGGAGISVWRPQ